MTQVVSPSKFGKDYLPGYTGHVPSKMEKYGASAGKIKEEILTDHGFHSVILDR